MVLDYQCMNWNYLPR